MNEPVAYFITFTCKGARLHGDSRGSVDPGHAEYGEEYCESNPIRASSAAQRMGNSAFALAPELRSVAGAAIQGVCHHRNWVIHGLAVRSNHVHVVVTAPGAEPERVMNDFKSYATRRLREAGLIGSSVKPWTRHGSTRYLWKETDLAGAVDYVREHQDDPARFRHG